MMDNATLYSSANEMQKKDAEEILVKFMKKLKCSFTNFNILDIGCGSGDVTYKILLPNLPTGFGQLVGADVSQEMINYARKTYNHQKLSFVQLDISQSEDIFLKEESIQNSKNKLMLEEIEQQIEELKLDRQITIKVNGTPVEFVPDIIPRFSSKGFDLVFSFYCLHWIPEQRKALKNIYCLLKPGGEALLVLLAKAPIYELYQKLAEDQQWSNYMTDIKKFISPYHFSKDPLQDFKTNLVDSGFEILECECRLRSYIFENIENLKNSIKAVNPFLSRIPKHLQQQYIEDSVAKIEELNLSKLNNNGYPVNYELLIAHVKKYVFKDM